MMNNLWIMAIGVANLIDGVVRIGTLGFANHSGLTSKVAMHYSHYMAKRTMSYRELPYTRFQPKKKSAAQIVIDQANAAAERVD